MKSHITYFDEPLFCFVEAYDTFTISNSVVDETCVSSSINDSDGCLEVVSIGIGNGFGLIVFIVIEFRLHWGSNDVYKCQMLLFDGVSRVLFRVFDCQSKNSYWREFSILLSMLTISLLGFLDTPQHDE